MVLYTNEEIKDHYIKLFSTCRTFRSQSLTSENSKVQSTCSLPKLKMLSLSLCCKKTNLF